MYEEACDKNLIGKLPDDCSIPVKEEPEKRLEVLCVHLARMERYPGREVLRAKDHDTVVHDRLSCLCQLAVAARFSSQVYDDSTRPHHCNGLFCYEKRGSSAWNICRCNDNVCSCHSS